MVETRTGKDTNPYTQEQQEKMAALVRENKERKELEKQAKLKAIAEEQAAKMKRLEEKMKRVQQEEEERRKAVEEEAAAEEAEEERKGNGKEAESSGTIKRDTDAAMEKKISEWVANLSLGEDEDAESYVTQDERDALGSELAAMADPMERREREEEQKLAWKLRMKREKKRRREEVNKLTAEVAKVQECRKEVLAQPDDKAKWDKVLGYLEVPSTAWMEERQASWSQEVALSAMRSGFRDFAREIVTHIGGEVRQLRDNVGKFCEGTIEGAKAIAAVEGEGRPRKESVKLKFPDAYGGKKEENFDNWEASVNSVAEELKERMPVRAKMKKESKGQLILVDVEVFRSRVGALIDSGATRSYISRGALKKLRLGLKVQKLADPIVSVLADNRTMRVEDNVEGVQAYFRLERDGKVEKVLHSLTLLVQDDLPFDVVLGMDWGEAAGATLHLREHECRLPSPSGEVKTTRLFHVSGVDNTLAHCCLSAPAFVRLVKEERLEEQVFVVYVRPVTEAKEEVTSTDPTIAKLLEEFKDLTESPTGVVPRPIQHRIEIEPGSRTPKGAVYRMSPRELEELRKQLDKLLEKGWIKPSSSPFGAPVLFVPKKEGELRMCIDYRGLNAITVKNAEPLPRIDDLLDRVQGCKYFSKIDLKSGYHQIEIHPDDQYKTAFRTRYGHYEFIMMPFGLTNAPATFQRCMNDLFRPWLGKYVVVYLDDILVFSKTLQEHQGHLRQVLEKMREANFKINPKKCEWAKTQALYLGHVLDGVGIKPKDSNYGNGFGNGYGNNYGGYGYNNGNWQGSGNPNRTFFTKEQAKFLEKLKFKQAVQEAAKQQTEVKPTPTCNSEPGLKIVEIGKKKTEDKEEEMKKWVTKTFCDSLKLLTEKLDEVDKKSKLAEDEKEEVKRLCAEKELLELKDNSSSEKRKRHPSTPSTSPRVDNPRLETVILPYRQALIRLQESQQERRDDLDRDMDGLQRKIVLAAQCTGQTPVEDSFLSVVWTRIFNGKQPARKPSV
ncbi:hypothetical protein CBR_g29726 [Chara braunii]|uniref:Reverse transcriptase domain-containing protein n=1 Tax=Chara braunii TaxID=69332 RepID=A0A388LB89_CHABU|nr:hypothetical protein CBR_g29726 [Chara braunii]|eukprot:GBG79579.1 hypothetical protein CBR_g29726 [Chara braunii]